MISRRLFAAATAASLAGLAAGRTARVASAQDAPTPRPTPVLVPVNVAYAASLATVMERDVARAVANLGLRFLGEGKGSVALANELSGGLRQPDVFLSADPKVIDGLMGAANKNLVAWYVTFATTRLQIAYARQSPYAEQFRDVARGRKRLADVLLSPNFRLGRTDPRLDPKGYRSIIAAQLLEAGGDAPAGFASRALGEPGNPLQVLPEETLLARLENGDVDAAFVYATESVARHLSAVELPKTANLGDPAEAKRYATQSVTIDGKTRVGAPASYAITIPAGAPNPGPAQSFVAFMLSPEGKTLLTARGLTVVAPMLTGDRSAVPEALRAPLGLH